MEKKIFYVLLLAFLTGFSVWSQEKATLSGTIADKSNNETLIGVSIYIPEADVSLTTNSYGFYSVTLPKGTYTVIMSYMGFSDVQEQVSLQGNTKKDFTMAESSKQLDEVVITSNATRANIKKPEMSVNKLSIATIKKMPAVMGEVDVLKSILQLPGVSNAQEGATGFNVRGGSVDGNLVLLDEAVVYNTSHLFGFFSVFNSDVIKDLKLYKGGIPANFGGRISSVLDIYQKEGNNKEYHVSGGLGLISSRLLVEGPIEKEKSSFVVAGRGSYMHLFLKLADEPNSVYFYDLNAKLNYKLNKNNSLFISGYYGYDYMNFNKSLINDYSNTFLNVRWNHIFSDKLFSNASAIYSNYDYALKIKYAGLNGETGIKNYNFKYDFKHYITNNFVLNYGINSIYYNFNPGTVTPFDGMSSVNPYQLEKKYAWENAGYISAEHKLSENLSMTYGLRYSNFMRLGKELRSTYADNRPVIFNEEYHVYEEATPTGSIQYDSNEKIASFDNLEPRFGVSYALNDDQSVKASYNRMSQYIHLISNTASATPLDIWAPSDQYLKPQILDQVAAGYFRNFKEDKYSLEAEVFYKKIKNKSDYIDGADLIAHRAIERVMLNGEGLAYGLELMVKKNTGKLTGWLSYTLSRAEQRTPGGIAGGPGINNGEWYRANYDKTHNLSLTEPTSLQKNGRLGAYLRSRQARLLLFLMANTSTRA